VRSASKPRFDIEQLRGLAGDKTFERGTQYFLDEHVSVIESSASEIRAQVRGTEFYDVRLRASKGSLRHECTCPAADEGDLCKHGVAVGLVWLSALGLGASAKARVQGDTPPKLGDLREPLEAIDQRELVGLVLDHAVTDERLERKLIAAIATRDHKQPKVKLLRRQIDRAITVHDFVDRREMGDYADGIGDCVAMLDDLSKRGRAADVIELAEHALRGIETALGTVDDSDGRMTPIMEELQRLHLAACRKAKPDGVELARRLVEWELHGEWEIFLGAAKTYAKVLGRAGLSEYRRLAQEKWAQVRTLAPGDSDAERYGSRFRITHIMESLADAGGDLADWIAVAQKDLSHAWSFVVIAEKCRKAGAHDLALEWAERGAKAFPRKIDSRLLEFLASEYTRRKRHDDAVAMRRRSFDQEFSVETYRALEKAATSAKCWPEERARAMKLLQREADRGDSTQLVEILLSEKDVDAAWTQALRGRCVESVVFEVAELREKTHPQDALPIYLARLKRSIESRNNDGYRDAVALLMRVRRIHGRLGTDAKFMKLAASVRATHKQKRNLIRLLDEALSNSGRGRVQRRGSSRPPILGRARRSP
jgi:uncharacterized Zn finger protein